MPSHHSSGYLKRTLSSARSPVSGRAQTSIEMLAVLAIGIIVLLVLVDFTNTQFNQIQVERGNRAGRAAVDQLVGAINAVYTQGPGAVKQISVIWPEGIDVSQTQISNHSIKIRVNGSDVAGTVIPLVTGNLPVNPGVQLVRLQAYDGFVSIGQLLLNVSPTFVLSSMNRDANKTVSFSIVNNGPSTAAISFTLDWNASDVNALLVGAGDLNLGSTGSAAKDVNFFSGSGAVGTYTGKLILHATIGDAVETQVVPLTMDVRVGSTSPLSIFPSTISITGYPGDLNTGTIQLCNLGSDTISGISFSPSVGDAGTWVQGVPDVNLLPGQSCQNVDVNAAIPNSANLGANAGTVHVQDYAGAHAQTLPLSVTVKGMGDAFVWDWNGSAVGTNNIAGFTLTNIGSKPVQISTIKIKNWWTCDTNHSNLSTIRFDNVNRFSGQAPDGNTLDVADFNLPVLTAWTDNALVFSGVVNDNNEQFASDVTFADGSIYSSSTHGDGCVPDTTAPAAINDVDFQLIGGFTYHLTFTFPGDDNYTGRVTSLNVRHQPSGGLPYNQIDTEAEWDAATPYDWNGTIANGGSSGTIAIGDYAAYGNMCVVFRGFDEAGNAGSLHNYCGAPLVGG